MMYTDFGQMWPCVICNGHSIGATSIFGYEGPVCNQHMWSLTIEEAKSYAERLKPHITEEKYSEIIECIKKQEGVSK